MKEFAFVFIPGTLCYAESFDLITNLMEGIINKGVMKKGGNFILKMFIAFSPNVEWLHSNASLASCPPLFLSLF